MSDSEQAQKIINEIDSVIEMIINHYNRIDTNRLSEKDEQVFKSLYCQNKSADQFTLSELESLKKSLYIYLQNAEGHEN